MQATYRSSELALEDRNAIERLVGRALTENETVQLRVIAMPDEVDALRSMSSREAAVRILDLSRGKSTGGMTAKKLIEEGRD